jgi:hypothetical protein
VANILCVYGIVEPRFVLDKAQERTSEGVLHVEWIAAEDRIAYMIACNDADSEQARLFRTFRDEPAHDVPGGQDGEVLGREGIRPAGDAGGGIRFGDPVQS